MQDLRDAIKNLVQNIYYDHENICIEKRDLDILIAEYNIHFIEPGRDELST